MPSAYHLLSSSFYGESECDNWQLDCKVEESRL